MRCGITPYYICSGVGVVAQLVDYSGGSSSWEGDEPRCIGSQSRVLASSIRQDNSKCHNFTYIRRKFVKLWPLG